MKRGQERSLKESSKGEKYVFSIPFRKQFFNALLHTQFHYLNVDSYLRHLAQRLERLQSFRPYLHLGHVLVFL